MMLKDFGFSTHEICQADIARVNDEPARWGSYYETSPTVITGNLGNAARTVLSCDAFRPMLNALEPQIACLAATLGTTTGQYRL